MSVDVEIIIDEKIEKKIEEPKKVKVIMQNDDKTPQEWVVSLLTEIFKHSQKTAENIMLTIHNEGSGVVGIYTYEIAEHKSNEAITASREQGFPLNIRLEEE